ncbi:hypothetical protein TCAL_00891 [Tigriopus californicus]|uniref:Uncharacterized protein n=1 Tax=Tigriopus californicus TaxID=6832 RepID=A0A553P6I5_TIGCA|nr:hypothetical protein TCAL_00891 [Tigriopus californicus]
MNLRCQNHILCVVALALFSHVEPAEPNRSYLSAEAKALEHSPGDLNHNQKDQLISKDISSTIPTSTDLDFTIDTNLKDQSSTRTDEQTTLETNLTKVTWAPQDLGSTQTEIIFEEDDSTPLPSVQPPVLLENPLEGKFKSDGRWGFRSGNFAPPPPIPPPLPPPSSFRFPPRPYEAKPRPRPSNIFPESNPYWDLPPWMSPFQSPFPFWPDLDYFDQRPFEPIPPHDTRFPPPLPFLTRDEGGPSYEQVPPRARFIIKK